MLRASNHGTRSPPKPTSSLANLEDEVEQPALTRFARQKQREVVGQTRSVPDLNQPSRSQPPNPTTATAAASSSSTVQPRPEKWSVKDTSVQIASAFHQAATSTVLEEHTTTAAANTSNTIDNSNTSSNAMSTPNDAWASGATRKQGVPRSTSVEYEKETHSTVNRRLGAPPNRLASKPLSKTASVRHVPDSEGEGEDNSSSMEFSRTSANGNGNSARGKSPFFDTLRKVAATSIFMRQEEENVNSNTSVSYDYSAEEREYQASVRQTQTQKPSSTTTANRRPPNSMNNNRRNRMPADNKAYKPSMSDLEESDEDFEEDGKRTRRKKGKKGTAVGGPLNTLPVTQYDKRRKKRRSAKGNGVDEGDEEELSSDAPEDDETLKASDQRSVRGTTPIQRALSMRSSQPPVSRASLPPRASVPPPDPLSDSAVPDTSGTDIENALSPIEEGNDTDLGPLTEYSSSYEISQPSIRPFSIGTYLGTRVHYFFKAIFSLIGGLFAFFMNLLDMIVLEPIRRVGNFIDSDGFAQMGKYVGVAFVVWVAWVVLNSGYLRVTVHRTSEAVGSISDLPHTVYVPPEAPPSDITELSDRLQKMEGALKALSLASERSRMHIEGNIRQHAEITGLIGALETAVKKEEKKANDIESRLGRSTKEGLTDLKVDLEILKARFDSTLEAAKREEAQAKAKPRYGYGGRGPATDEEARAKLRALEERVGSTEAGVKEALELGRNSATIAVGVAAGGAGSVSAWWSKLASGKPNGITIKSSDGHDLTNIISNMVDQAVAKTGKDDLAKPDYAMYSGGASVIPSLTSDTYEVRPATFVGRVIAGVTGLGHAVGRPPVTALHHEMHIGYCWPFQGSTGQLGVNLAFPTVIREVTIDHVPRELATDPRSAPREMQLWGMLEGEDNIRKYTEWVWEKRGPIVVERVMKEVDGTIFMDDGDDEDEGPVHEDDFVGYPATLPRNPVYVKVAEFVYNVHSEKAIQTFPVREEIAKLGLDFGVVVLVVESNWGKEEQTCLYRLRVHGERLGGIPEPLGEEFAVRGAKAAVEGTGQKQ